MRARATSIVLVTALLTSLTGCAFTAVQATELPYDASDGISAEVGDVHVRNALLISDDGTKGNLVVSVINPADKNVALNVSWEVASGRNERNIYVKAGGTQSLGEPSNQLILRGIDAQPGSLFPVYFQYGDNEGQEVLVPVLDGSLPEYADLVPGE